MQIVDPARLLSLRQRKGLSRPQLAERSKVNERTIQRLEKEPQPSRKNTLNRLATALGVKPGVLTGALPLPEFGKAPASDSKPPQVSAQIAPKVRLAYDLIKIRYDVSATEIINMAPLFFALLAEGSLAWRREKLKELKEGIDRLKQIDGFWREYNVHLFALTVDNNDIETEKDSIAKADLFGEHLLGCVTYDLDPSTDNPFASYLRKLKAELAIPGVVDVDSGNPMFGSPLKFSDYDVCRDELDGIANGSDFAKAALEIGHTRLSGIPKELMAEDAGEERAKWLEDKLSGTLKDLEKKRKEIDDRIAEIRDNLSKGIHIDEGLEIGELLAEQVSLDERREEISKRREELVRSLQKTNSDIKKGGNDQ